MINNMSETGNLPNLIIIGAMKSGTTSLHYYLNLHPDICMSQQKELDFFVEERNWHRGVQWYKSNFIGQAKIYGESSTNYTNYPTWQGVSERVFSIVPEAKLIYILRNPIERIISQYVHRCVTGRENRTIKEALAELDDNIYLQRSKYFLQLEQYLKFFSDSSILILTLEELSNFPQKTMKKVFQFLEVDADFQFKLKLKSMGEIVRFGRSITNSDFQFNVKLYESSRRRRMTLSENSLIRKTVSTITAPLPAEVKYHLERVIYQPFSYKVERPKIDNILRQRLLDNLAENISKLQEYTGCSFDEWNLK